jgi:MerR family transcriptional regulator/heat shock protein HspR
MYEREGLIIAQKRKSKHRQYTPEDIYRIRNIRRMIKEKRLNIPGIKALYAMIPCWHIVDCSAADRKNCCSYENALEPCWTFKHIDNVCGSRTCRTCTVYNDYIDDEKIKEALKNI